MTNRRVTQQASGGRQSPDCQMRTPRCLIQERDSAQQATHTPELLRVRLPRMPNRAVPSHAKEKVVAGRKPTMQFVILEHHPGPNGPRSLHWDFMLEIPDATEDVALRAWALDQKPQPEVVVNAEELPPHRRHYLSYEGPVSGGRGEVTRLDRGTYERKGDASEADDGALVVLVSGDWLQGTVSIYRDKGDLRFVWKA